MPTLSLVLDVSIWYCELSIFLGRAYTRQAYTPMYALLSSSLTFMRNAISFSCSKPCRVDVESIKALSNVVSFQILLKTTSFFLYKYPAQAL